ncbi:MAG TPA: MDR family MFS transporter [Candidatus Sulfotelmatobacter sp.]
MDAASKSSKIGISSFTGLSRAQLIFALAGTMLTLLTSAMDQSISTIAMPHAIASLNGFARYSWPATSFSLTSAIAIPVFAKLSDLYGRKWLYLFCAAFFVVALLVCGAAGTLPIPLDGMNQLVVARGFAGLANGGIIAISYTLIADLFPPSERGRYQGLLGGVWGIALFVGPIFGGWVTDHASWRWAFFADIPFGILAMAMVYISLPDLRFRFIRHGIDWAGIATLCGWMVPLLLALTWVGQSGWSAPRIRELLMMSAVLLAAFLLIERRAAEPLLVLSLFRDRRIALASSSLFQTGSCIYGIAFYLPLFLQGVLDASAAKSAIVFTQYSMSFIAGYVLGGQLLSRTGQYRLLALVGSGLASIGLLLLSQMNGSTTHLEILRNVILCGVGLGVLPVTYDVLVQNAAPREQMGVATGSTQFFMALGGTLGLALFGTILLRLYHLHVDRLIPPGTPTALVQVFDNPLQLVFQRPNLEEPFSHIANGHALLLNLLEGARAGLLSAVHSIFLAGAGIMAVPFVLNLFLSNSVDAEGSRKIQQAPPIGE